MKSILFLSFIFYSLSVTCATPAENQTWKVRPGDTFDIIATTLEIPGEEIQKLNPGVSENTLQIGQKLKLPLRSYLENTTLEKELGKTHERIAIFERDSSELERRIANAESQLFWYPLWFWGFWICFGIVAFIVCGAYWIFRETHPRVFEQSHDRSIKDLRESQTRMRSTFPDEEQSGGSGAGQWVSLKRFPHARS
jgi:LysM repeat protein